MIFHLDTDCFKRNVKTFELVTLANTVLNGRHRLFVSDQYDNDYLDWLDGLDEDFRERWELSLDLSFESEALEPAKISIEVSQNRQSDHYSSPPILGVVEALKLAEEPFRVFVENDEADRNFLLTFANRDQKSKIEELEERKLLRFEHSGGIGELTKRVARFTSKDPLYSGICAAVFDSDAPQPGDISSDAKAVKRVCSETAATSFMLRRRAIENYLLRSWLKSWVNAKPKATRRQYIGRFTNLCQLNESQRAHFHMKKGLSADQAQISNGTITLYGNLDETLRRNLKSGFGSDVGSELYSSQWIQDSVHPFEDPDAWNEVNGIVQEFLSLCR